jgi:RNA polymerase sigma-70 factor (ECF subfamily)
MERYRSGDPSALNEFMASIYPLVYRFAFRLGGSGASHEDLVQASLEQVCRAARSFAGRSRVSTFVFGVCQRVASHHRRTERVRRLFRGHAEASLVPKERTDPDIAVERVEALHEARKALARLNAEERTVFVLHEIENLPLEEVAIALRCSIRTVKRRVHTARSKFAEPLP